MSMLIEELADFDNWEEIAKGIYKKIINPDMAYEIVLIHYPYNKNILDAEAELYIMGDWLEDEDGENYLGRDLLDCGTVQECVIAAVYDCTRVRGIKERNKIKTEKEKLLDFDTAYSIIGCYEGWYDSYYSINKTFSKDEIKAMSDKEIDDLEKLANRIASGLYI